MGYEHPSLQLFARQMRIYTLGGPSEAAPPLGRATFRSSLAYIYVYKPLHESRGAVAATFCRSKVFLYRKGRSGGMPAPNPCNLWLAACTYLGGVAMSYEGHSMQLAMQLLGPQFCPFFASVPN